MCGGRHLIKLAVVRWKSIGLLVRRIPTIPVTGTGRPASLGSIRLGHAGWALNRLVNCTGNTSRALAAARWPHPASSRSRGVGIRNSEVLKHHPFAFVENQNAECKPVKCLVAEVDLWRIWAAPAEFGGDRKLASSVTCSDHGRERLARYFVQSSGCCMEFTFIRSRIQLWWEG